MHMTSGVINGVHVVHKHISALITKGVHVFCVVAGTVFAVLVTYYYILYKLIHTHQCTVYGQQLKKNDCNIPWV